MRTGESIADETGPVGRRAAPGVRAANHVDAHVGQKVRERRMELGVSQERLAQMLGVAFQQVQKYERGVNRISASRLFQISHALEVPVGYFFEGLSGGDSA
jgi:ribosome-binding protein aMBF1 (putative translation factor)